MLVGTGSFASVAHAGEEFSDFTSGPMPGIVQEEYTKTQHQLQADFSAAQERIRALLTEKEAARARASMAAKSDGTGLKLMNDFDLFLKTKYVDKKGKFQPGLELAKKDIDVLNGILQEHLAMTPLFGRVSAGQAKKQLAWSVDYLNDIMKAHRDPSEANNSEFEIIGKQIRDETARSEKANMLAETLGFRLDVNQPAPRAPANAAATSADNTLPSPPESNPRRAVATKKKIKQSETE